MDGRVIGIVRAAVHAGPLEELDRAEVSVEAGIAGDCRGPTPGAQISVLFREAWDAACEEAGAGALPWTTRRANLYVEGLEPPQAEGVRLQIGEVILQVAQETKPCALMERAFRGLRDAMRPQWRGGVCCNVIRGGVIRLDDDVRPLIAART